MLMCDLRAYLLLVPVLLCSAMGESGESTVSEKALKYHKLLSNRPEPGYLFDRFYNTWLDESTVDELEAFLTKRASDSGSAPDQLLLAFFHVKKGDDVAALDRFNAALASNPASADIWYHKALVEARTLDFDLAIDDLKKAREQRPDEKLAVRIDKQLGKLLVRNQQTPAALKVWQQLLAAHPKDEELAEDLIELEIDEGLFKEAQSQSIALIERTNDPYLNVMRRLRLGDIHQRAGDRQQAVEVYTAALDDVGTGTWLEREILAQIDQVMRREDDVAGLKRLYEQLGNKYSKRIAIHRRNAQLLLELGENDAALAAQRAVLELTPGDRSTREEYIVMLAKVGQHDEAVKELRSLCDQNEKDAELRFRLASLFSDAKKTDESIAAVDGYLAVSDRSEYAYLRAARLLQRMDDKEAAARVYSEMSERFADSASAQEAYAAFLYAQGRKPEAIEIWKKLAANADVSQTLHVARAFSARNEHQAALDLLATRQEEFAQEPLYLGQLVSTAFALKKFDDAIPWALARVEAASSVADLETAIDQAANTIARAEKIEDVARELDGRTQRPINVTCLLAELLELAGDSKRADEVLQQPKSAEGKLYALSEQIRLHSQRRDWTAAADATRQILELPAGRKSLYVRRLVELYQRDFQFEEGLKWIQDWKRLSPGSTTPWLTEARILGAMGKPEESLKVLRTAVQQFDDDEELRVRLAELYAADEKHADAERIYWQLYEQTEDLGGKLRWAQELGKLAQQQGNVEHIVQNFNERAASNRRSIVPLLSLSEVYRQTDDYEGRRRALTAAAKIKPDDIHLLQQIARVEEQDGDWQAAISTLERAAALDNTNRTREQIAMLHLQYGDQEEGFRLLIELADGADADPRTIETTADALCGMQEWERAADFLRERVHEHPADYRLRYLYAVALEEAVQSNAAVEEYLQLLNPQEELPSKKSNKTNPVSQVSSYYGMIRQLVPAAAADWFELMQYRYQAYAHRQQSGFRMTIASGWATRRSSIQLPSNVEMVRPMAMTHALAIAATLEDDRRLEVCRVLKTHGMEHAEAYGSVDISQGQFTAAIAEVLEKDPDDETALAVLVLQRISGQDQSLKGHVEHAVEKFRESRPQLAMMAAIQAGTQNSADVEASEDPHAATSNKYFDEALAIADDLEQPNPIVVIGITTALGGQPGRSMQTQISEDYRQKFARLMLDWYPKLINSPWGNYAFYMVLQSLAQSDDHTNYVQFLDDEVGRFQLLGGPKSQNFAARAMSYGGNSPQTLAVPTFPPPQLTDFPPNVLALFQSQQMSPFGNALQPPGGDVEPEVKLKPLLDSVKSPVLRVLLMHRAKMLEQVDAAIAEMFAAKTPSVDAYLMAAGRAAEQEKFVDVVQLLGKARYLPMKQDMRQQVDSGIVAAVLAVSADERKSNTDLVEAGQQACLRMRRARLDLQQRHELIAAMEDLGLKKEAEKLDELATAVPSGSNSRQVIYSSAASRSAQQDRVGKLVADGKSDVAVKLLTGEVSAHVRQALASGQSMRHYSYEIRRLRQRIESFGLFDDVIKSLDPGGTRNPARIGEYAMACRLFDMNDEARRQFERVIELRPRDDTARMQLIMLVGASDSAAAEKQIEQLSKPSRDEFGRMLAEQLQDYEITVTERLGYAHILAKFIAAIDESDVSQSYWLEYGLQSLARQMRSNRGGSLPSLYSLRPESGESRNQRGISPDDLHRRREIHEAICEAILAKPSFARTGFRHLLAASEARSDNLDQFADLALSILTDEAEAKPGGQLANQQRMYWNSNVREVRLREPEDFLARRAWQTGDWKLIDEALLLKLEGGRTRDTHKRLEGYAQLYRCDESEFVELAESTVRRFRPQANAQENEALALVVEVWADRGLDVDLRPMVLRHVKLEVNSSNHHQPPSYLVQFIENAAEKLHRTQQLEFLDEVATIYVAPPKRRNEFIKKHYQSNMMSYGTPNGKIHVFGTLLEELCQQGPLMFLVLEHLQQYDVPPVDNLEYRVQSATSGAIAQGTEETLELLDASPWLADLDNFQPLSGVNVGGRASLGRLLQQLSNTANVRDEVRKQLESRQAQKATFGVGLVLAFLEQQQQIGALLGYLGTQLDAIHELSDGQQLDLANLMQDLVRPDAIVEKSLSDSAKAARDWVIGSQAGRSQALVAKVKKAKRLEELGIKYYQVDDFFRKQVSGLIDNDPAAAAQIVLLVSDLAREAQRRGEWHMYFGDGNSTEGYILRQAVYSAQIKNWGAYCLVVDTIRNQEGRGIEVSNSAPRAASQAVNAAFKRTPKLPDGKSPTVVDRIQSMYEECGEGLAGRPSSLMIRGFCDHVNGKLNEQSCAELREWLRDEKEDGKYPELAADLDATVAVIAAQKQKEKGKKHAPGERRELADYHQRFLDIFTDRKLPLTWRIYLADFLAVRERETLPLEVARAIAQLNIDAIAAGVPIDDGEHIQLTFVVDSLLADPPSRELIKDWRERWAARFLKRNPRQRNGQRPFENLDRLSAPDPLCRALAIYYAAEDTQQAARILRHYDTIGNLPQTAATLIRAKQFEEVAKLIRARWATIDIGWPNEPSSKYDAELAALLPDAYKQFDRDDQRYFAELLFASMPDSKSLGDAPHLDERLSELSQRFAEVEFADRVLRRRVLVLLSRNDATRDEVADCVAEEFDAERLAAAFQSQGDNTLLTQETQLAVSHLRNRLAADDAAALAQLLKRLNAVPSRDDYEFGQRVWPLLECCRNELRNPGAGWSPDDCGAIVAELQVAMSNREYVYYPNYRDFNSLMTALIARSGQIEAAAKWLKSLQENNYRQMVNQGLTDDVWKLGARLTGPPTEENLEERIAYVGRVFTYVIDRKWDHWDPRQSYHLRGEDDDPCFESIVKSKLLSNDELQEHGDEIVKQVGDVRYATAAWAAWLENAKEYDRAAAIWQKVVDAEPKSDEDAKHGESKLLDDRVVYHVVSLARCQAKSGDAEAAKATLAELNGKKIPPPMRKDLQKLRQELAKNSADKLKETTGGSEDRKDAARDAVEKKAAGLHRLPSDRVAALLFHPPAGV